jgi:hypothetical protein
LKEEQAALIDHCLGDLDWEVEQRPPGGGDAAWRSASTENSQIGTRNLFSATWKTSFLASWMAAAASLGRMCAPRIRGVLSLVRILHLSPRSTDRRERSYTAPPHGSKMRKSHWRNIAKNRNRLQPPCNLRHDTRRDWRSKASSRIGGKHPRLVQPFAVES